MLQPSTVGRGHATLVVNGDANLFSVYQSPSLANDLMYSESNDNIGPYARSSCTN